ncbi:DUF6257 family protein [Streptomyces sp. ID05-47C]|uniref:DUF6257 family protein n=1 Tax=Streptomyces sp. ID05-47C TaxID=3028665 RepID=UPI0029B004AF|nr:DUF6257 family protein [Streptomyces sp. ID05-47C]MDX3570818.1 DUF6257 family protein [Streptomyces sp. ID05-47C]
MADDLTAADLTLGEKARIGVLIARAAKRGAAGPNVDISDLTRRIERIEKQARSRKNGK